MDTLTELALKGHFDQLKQDANKKNLNDQPVVLLMKALSYLEKVNSIGQLDSEGRSIIEEIKGLQGIEPKNLKPKPMKKARGVSKSQTTIRKNVG